MTSKLAEFKTDKNKNKSIINFHLGNQDSKVHFKKHLKEALSYKRYKL